MSDFLIFPNNLSITVFSFVLFCREGVVCCEFKSFWPERVLHTIMPLRSSSISWLQTYSILASARCGLQLQTGWVVSSCSWGQVGTVRSAKSEILLAWCTSDWPRTLKSPAIMMGLSAFPCASVRFCLGPRDTAVQWAPVRNAYCWFVCHVIIV